MEIQTKAAYAVSGDVVFQEVSGETVLLDLNSESYFGLDEVGTRVWALINEGRAVDEMISTLLDEYDVDRATLEADVAALVTSLLEAGLVVESTTCADG